MFNENTLIELSSRVKTLEKKVSEIEMDNPNSYGYFCTNCEGRLSFIQSRSNDGLPKLNIICQNCSREHV